MRTAAEFIQNLDFDYLDDGSIQKTKDCILDFVGAVLGGAKTKAANIALGYIGSLGGSEEATLWPTNRKVPCPSAAFVHGTMGTSLDIDDGHRIARGHPGGVVIPAAFSVAEHSRMSGKKLIEAILCGYEVGIRTGQILRAMNSKVLSLGSGRWGSTGAAAAVAKLMDLTVEETEQALGISATYAPIAAATEDLVHKGIMPMTKLSSGWGAMVGIWAAFLAQKGFTGITSAIDFSLGSLPQLGTSFEINNVYFKPYPACRYTHPAIEGIMQLMKDYNDLKRDTIKRIVVKTFREAAHLKEPRPQTLESAQYSIPFLVGVAAIYGEVSHDQINENRLLDPEILNIASKVEIMHDPVIDNCFPKTAPSEVEVETNLGKSYRIKIERPKGDPLNPMSDKELLEKFKGLAARSISAEASEKIAEAINAMEKLSDITELIALLVNSVRGAEGS